MNTYTKKRIAMLSVYSFTHLLVDFACAFLMFNSVSGTVNGYIAVLLYNFFAFAMQMPLGLIADKLNRNYLFAMNGCLLVGAAYAFTSVPLAAAVIIGAGNAMFHVGGGIDVLNISEKKLGALGIFVSPGAIGVFLGTVYGRTGGFPIIIILLALALSAAAIYAVRKWQGCEYMPNAALSLKPSMNRRHAAVLAVACLFTVVCLRSFVGLSLNFGWRSGLWAYLLLGAVVLGKTAGGFVADRFGLFKTAAVSLGVAVVLFMFSDLPLAGVAAVFLFNMTMPITLWTVAKIFNGTKGFGFGLLTFALFIGFLPAYLGVTIPLSILWVFAAVSLVILLVGIRKER